jgi:hypothetical protein
MKKNLQKNLGGSERKLGLKKLHFWVAVNLGLVFFVLLLAFWAYRVFHGQNIAPEIPNLKNQTKKIDNNLVMRLIDGVQVEPGQENNYPVAVMIDNSPEARPQAGLSQANYVIEAEAEGGITRYLAIFAEEKMPEKIGPVRSARPYFIDWAQEFSAVYTHCGGSPEALVKITREGIIDLNQFYRADLFWRDNNGIAPHNVYTSGELLNEFLVSKNLSEGKFFPFSFKKDLDFAARPEQHEININYRLRGFHVNWVYDKDNNDYIRFVSGQEYKDASGESIRAKNIIVQEVDARVLDEKLRLEMDIVGEGEAYVCLDGICQEGTWKKKSSTARTRFYDNSEQEFKFNPGTTWVEVVRPDIKFTLGSEE